MTLLTERTVAKVRPFTPRDIPQVVALRRRVFRQSSHASDDDLARYFESIFFSAPMVDEDLPSLVYEDSSGECRGFIGVLSRTFERQGKRLRAAITTQFMVAPDSDPLVAPRLLRAAFNGRQDLTLADAANDTARRLCVASGARVAWPYCHEWHVALRPARSATAAMAERGVVRRAAMRSLRPAAVLTDAVAARIGRDGPWRAPSQGTSEPVDVRDSEGVRVLLDVAVPPHPLRPLYDEPLVGWLLGQLHAQRDRGSLECIRVLDARGRVAGGALYYANAGGVCEVMQCAARPGAVPLVFDHLCHHAWTLGGIAIRGRLDPSLAVSLDRSRYTCSRAPAWALAHARQADIEHIVLSGELYWSRLEGESVFRF
jgi:hypothetical protein